MAAPARGDHPKLSGAIRATLGETVPVAVVIDTLNRTLRGSESSDEDISAYINAADAIREAFRCAVVVVHHCGIDDNRPRGHSSLTGAADAPLAATRDGKDNIVVTVECMKDGPEGDRVYNRLQMVEVGTDDDGDTITSCIVEPVEAPPKVKTGPKLTPNQQTMLDILSAAGDGGLTWGEWHHQADQAGVGAKRKADRHESRNALEKKGLVCQKGDRWHVRS